jgi:hypothetical protein
MLTLQTFFDSLQAGWPDWLGEVSTIGRLFSFVTFITLNYIQKYPKFGATFLHNKYCVLILANNGLGCILGDFFTNPSGHPVLQTPLSQGGEKWFHWFTDYISLITSLQNWPIYPKMVMEHILSLFEWQASLTHASARHDANPTTFEFTTTYV